MSDDKVNPFKRFLCKNKKVSDNKFILFEDIDWSKEGDKHILKIRNEIRNKISTEIKEEKEGIRSQRKDIEPWLTAIFQSEHLSLLVGSGMTLGLSKLAGFSDQSMDNLDLSLTAFVAFIVLK